MLLKKAEEKAVETTNPYQWPENYYLETDPEKRKAILEVQNNPEEAELNKLRMELWNLRYEKMKNGKYKDTFLGAMLEFLIMRGQSVSAMGKRRMKKDAQKALEMFGIPKAEHFGKELLVEEIKHAVLLYSISSLNDKNYNAVLFGFGKKKKENVEAKITSDLDAVGHEVPEKLEMVEECQILTEAIEQAKAQLGYGK